MYPVVSDHCGIGREQLSRGLRVVTTGKEVVHQTMYHSTVPAAPNFVHVVMASVPQAWHPGSQARHELIFYFDTAGFLENFALINLAELVDHSILIAI